MTDEHEEVFNSPRKGSFETFQKTADTASLKPKWMNLSRWSSGVVLFEIQERDKIMKEKCEWKRIANAN